MELIDKARGSIADFCINKCKGLCCRKGKLVLTEDELKLVSQGKKLKPELEKTSLYSININKKCPSLGRDIKCKIYFDNKRPQVCKDFPLFVFGKNIVVAPFCTAAKKGLLDSYFKELKAQGYRII
jgi:Fe-S-cluster containining protein